MVERQTIDHSAHEPLPERLLAILARARAKRATAVHLAAREGVALRVFGAIERVADGALLEPPELTCYLERTLDRIALARLERIGVADAVHFDPAAGAFRVHASLGKDGPRIAVRLLETAVPNLESLNLPAGITRLADLPSGLVVVCGPGGSGKTTTAHALLDRLNRTQSKHILTVEQPIEFVHVWQRCVVTQLEVARDVAGFAHGLRAAAHADADVVFTGEVADQETADALLQVAEESRLAFAVITSPPDTSTALSRFITFFASEERGRALQRLAETLRAAVALRLVRSRSRTGLQPVVELLVVNEAVRRILREGTLHQLRAAIAAGARAGSQTLEQHAAELLAAGEIGEAEARTCTAEFEGVHAAARGR